MLHKLYKLHGLKSAMACLVDLTAILSCIVIITILCTNKVRPREVVT